MGSEYGDEFDKEWAALMREKQRNALVKMTVKTAFLLIVGFMAWKLLMAL